MDYEAVKIYLKLRNPACILFDENPCTESTIIWSAYDTAIINKYIVYMVVYNECHCFLIELNTTPVKLYAIIENKSSELYDIIGFIDECAV